ncbi:hypothetical protein D3C72_689940 [compost metagenome]
MACGVGVVGILATAAVAAAVFGFHFGPVILAAVGLEGRGIGQPRARRRRGPWEPALARQVFRQHFLFQRAARRIRQRRATARLQHQRCQLGHLLGRAGMPARRGGVRTQVHPVKAIRRQRQQIRQFADGRKRRAAQHFHRHAAAERLQRQFHGLRRVGQVGHAQDDGVVPLPQVRQNLAVAGLDEAQRAAAERVGLAALRQHAAGPVQQGMRVALLGLDVDGLVTVQRPHQHG